MNVKMANMSYHIANLLEKMLSTDKDFRFMATNDLMTELQVIKTPYWKEATLLSISILCTKYTP